MQAAHLLTLYLIMLSEVEIIIPKKGENQLDKKTWIIKKA